MVYELRTYWAAPGKIEELHNRFRNVTLNIFERLDMLVVGFWEPVPPTPESGDLVYILAFADVAAKDKAWETFRADPAWIAGLPLRFSPGHIHPCWCNKSLLGM